MISGDPVEIQVKLANLVREPRKFICLNDNIDYKLRTEANQLKSMLNTFYSNLFQLKSSFEIVQQLPGVKPVSQESSSQTNENYISNTRSVISTTTASVPNTQRIFFFLPILVGVFFFCLYLLKKWFLNDEDDDENDAIRRSSPRSFSSRINLIRKSPSKKPMNSPSTTVRKHKLSSAFRRKMEEADYSTESDNLSRSSESISTLSEDSSTSRSRSTMSSTINNETAASVGNRSLVKKSSSLAVREGLTRKNKKNANKSLIS